MKENAANSTHYWKRMDLNGNFVLTVKVPQYRMQQKYHQAPRRFPTDS